MFYLLSFPSSVLLRTAFILVSFLYVVILITTGAQNGLGCGLASFASKHFTHLCSSLWSSGLSITSFSVPLTSLSPLKRKMAAPKAAVCKLGTKYLHERCSYLIGVMDKPHVLVQHAAPTSPVLKKIIKIICVVLVWAITMCRFWQLHVVVSWVGASPCLHAPLLSASLWLVSP